MFQLTVDGPGWHRHLRETLGRMPDLVPVVKGNGYGFGADLLARQCAMLEVDTVAVGVPAEIAAVRRHFGGDVLVMSPLGAAEAVTVPSQPDVIRTVSHLDVLATLAARPDPPPVVVELDSPVHRHGIEWTALPELAPLLAALPVHGVALHLPMDGRRLHVARAALAALLEAGVHPGTLWVSHLGPAELSALAGDAAGVRVRPRIGTALWLGDRSTFVAQGTVLDRRPVPREAVGYRQRRHWGGTLVVVSGGTAHGVGLRSLATPGGVGPRLRSMLAGAAHGAGVTPSPFHWAGRRLRFADVPHMQVSMLLVPRGVDPPEVGDRLPCDVRMTVTVFDAVEVAGTAPLEHAA